MCPGHFRWWAAARKSIQRISLQSLISFLSLYYDVRVLWCIKYHRFWTKFLNWRWTPPPLTRTSWLVAIKGLTYFSLSHSLSIHPVFIIDPLPAAACAFNGLAMKLSVGFIGSIDWHAESERAKSSMSSQPCVDPKDVATGALKQGLRSMCLSWWSISNLFQSEQHVIFISCSVRQQGKQFKLQCILSLLHCDNMCCNDVYRQSHSIP